MIVEHKMELLDQYSFELVLVEMLKMLLEQYLEVVDKNDLVYDVDVDLYSFDVHLEHIFVKPMLCIND